MNDKSRNETAETPESESEPECVHVELTEAECSIVQQALQTVGWWNRQENDKYLCGRHQDIRELFIDAHEEYLKAQKEGRP